MFSELLNIEYTDTYFRVSCWWDCSEVVNVELSWPHAPTAAVRLHSLNAVWEENGRRCCWCCLLTMVNNNIVSTSFPSLPLSPVVTVCATLKNISWHLDRALKCRKGFPWLIQCALSPLSLWILGLVHWERGLWAISQSPSLFTCGAISPTL